VLEDLEFVQFHPTALAVPGAPPFLLSEAMRGEGAILRNTAGEAFMARYDARRELAPRDVVAQAIWEEMGVTGSDHVFLDVTALPRAWLLDRFPLIATTCRRYGLDITAAPIPVAPAAHFMIGGITTDVRGRTNVHGLYAVGEAACSGVHGANRLASNSLLEGLVFGARAGRAAAAGARARRDVESIVRAEPPRPVARVDRARLDAIREAVPRLMWDGVGIVRTAASIRRALEGLNRESWMDEAVFLSRKAMEVKNLRLVAALVAGAALERKGSLGCHFRRDFPAKGTGWQRHISVVRLVGGGG
jgi:L-aspartate oxidase